MSDSLQKPLEYGLSWSRAKGAHGGRQRVRRLVAMSWGTVGAVVAQAGFGVASPGFAARGQARGG